MRIAEMRIAEELSVRSPASTFRYLLQAPGYPWRVRLRVQRRKPRDQRRNFKNSLRTGNQHHPRRFASPALAFDHVVREFVAIWAEPREMLGEQMAGASDPFDKGVGEASRLKCSRIASTNCCQNSSPHFW